MGSGCAFIDLDGDGCPDILLVNSKDWTPRGRRSLAALYRNNRQRHVHERHRGQRPRRSSMYGMGVAVGDYDNDGRDDVYITALDGDRLFHNEGGCKFRDVTKTRPASSTPSFGTSAAWFGLRPRREAGPVRRQLRPVDARKATCGARSTASRSPTARRSRTRESSSRLFRNLGDGRFEDVTQKARSSTLSAKSLGVTVLDYDGDGWPDLFVANDTQPNKLYRNLRNGTFTEEAVAAGVAFGEDGVARGAMGVDSGDYDRSGRPHLLVGNFSNQMLGLYRNEGKGLFVDEAPRSAVGRASLLCLSFGVFFFDYDLDGWLDIFAANGHIEEEIGRVQPKVHFAQSPLLFRNLGRGKFDDVSNKLGPDLSKPMVARGAAYADYDHDGDLDLLISANHGAARLLRNDAAPKGRNWIRLQLEGTKSNRSAIGAVVRVDSTGGRQWNMVRSGSSYCSASDLSLTFGLGGDTDAAVEIEWPSGDRQKLGRLRAGKTYAIVEGRSASQERAERQ